MTCYHLTVTSALQTVARVARSSPVVAVIPAPIDKVEQIAQRQVARYPTITVDHGTRTALRKAKLAAVQLVVMPPLDGALVLLLMANIEPPGSREEWRNALDPEAPLVWRNYALHHDERGQMTWRLSERAREHYRTRIARLITGRGGLPLPGKAPYQLSPDSSRQQIEALAHHMAHYPGLSGVRADVFALAQYSTKVWKSTHQEPVRQQYPVWPTMPYVRFGSPQTAPLHQLSSQQFQEVQRA